MKRFFLNVREGIRIFSKNDCFTSAAAISFYAFFSLIPLMLLITALLGFVLGTRPGLLERVIGMVRQSLPFMGDLVIRDLKGISRQWSTFGWVGLFFLLSSADLVLGALADALGAVFGVNRQYGFLRRKILNLLVLLIGVLAALVSVSMTAAAIITKKLHVDVFGVDFLYHLIQSLAFKFLLPFLLLSLIVAAIYRIMSGPNLNLRYAFYGSLMFTVSWEAAKHLFAWYVSNFQSYNKFYGSLGALMVLLIWIFYSANIFLFSACWARASYARTTGKNR